MPRPNAGLKVLQYINQSTTTNRWLLVQHENYRYVTRSNAITYAVSITVVDFFAAVFFFGLSV